MVELSWPSVERQAEAAGHGDGFGGSANLESDVGEGFAVAGVEVDAGFG